MNEIEEVKARLDVVEIIGQYVQLQKAGRSYKALCPFHAEKTPSFIVSPERQSWHCFGACGTGGDVFSFVMRKEGLEFGQALGLLADKAGVRLSARGRSEEEDGQRQRLLAANEAAAQWFHHLLLNNQAAKGARDYVERRGVDAPTAESFALGYSLDGWEGLRKYLAERGFSDAEMLGAGLLVEGESGLHDRFRGRLMFPIRDVRGRVIGFGARALDDSPSAGSLAGQAGQALPKYLNTSQTAIFDKGSTLYGLDRAGEAIRRDGRAVIVEGYMDVIAAHQHGFENVVATMGTALTERQVRLVKRHAQSIVLALDADQAGSEAALRGHEVVQEALRQPGEEEETVPVVTFWRGLVRAQEVTRIDLRVAVLPEGRDPDDVIRNDPDAWREFVGSARPLLDHRFEVAAARHDLSDPRGRSEAVHELMPLLSALIDPVMRQQYLQRLARLALMRESEVVTMLARSRSGARTAPEPGPVGAGRSARGGPASPGSDAREEFLLALLLRYPDLREDGLAFPDELLWGSENRELLQAWRQAAGLDQLRELLPEELAAHLERLLERRLPEYDSRGAREALADCRRRLERRQLETEKQLSSALLAAQEEELGPSTLVEAAVSATNEDDERMKEFESLHLRDMETGIRLHRPHRRGEGGEINLPGEGQD